MRITGDDDIGKKQLDNFRDVGSRYPVLVTTSKLLTTGVDIQMVKNIVLDATINSMTEFKQIIGRGTRVREDLGKMFFTIFDFRGVTRHFADDDFDGPCEQDDDFVPKTRESRQRTLLKAQAERRVILRLQAHQRAATAPRAAKNTMCMTLK